MTQSSPWRTSFSSRRIRHQLLIAEGDGSPNFRTAAQFRQHSEELAVRIPGPSPRRCNPAVDNDADQAMAIQDKF